MNIFVVLFSLLFAPLLADSPGEEAAQTDIAKISEAFGHLIGKNIETLGVEFDMEEVVKGLKGALAGKEAPMSEQECVAALTLVQEETFQKEAEENLKKAEEFLTKNAQEKDIVVLKEGKLHYKKLKEGSGSSLQEHATPQVRYEGKHLDGTIFTSVKEEQPLCLDEVIAGLKEGLVGMKEGEKRTLYIHPDLAYGTKGMLPPNSLLTFEVELVKADTPLHEEESKLYTDTSTKIKDEAPEIADPAAKRQAIR